MSPKNGSREVSKKNCTSKEDFTQDYCIRGSRLLQPQREIELCRNKREEITLGSLSQKADRVWRGFGNRGTHDLQYPFLFLGEKRKGLLSLSLPGLFPALVCC